jgi:hypothetical protein
VRGGLRRFAYRLALKTGRVNVDKMLREMTGKQLQEWLVYAQLEPFDEEREDYRTASVVQAFINMNRDTKKHPDGFKLDDVVLRFGDNTPPPPVQQDWQRMKAITMAIAEAYKEP